MQRAVWSRAGEERGAGRGSRGGGLSLKGEEETLAVGTGGDRASAELGGELAEGAEGIAVAAQRGAQRLDQRRVARGQLFVWHRLSRSLLRPPHVQWLAAPAAGPAASLTERRRHGALKVDVLPCRAAAAAAARAAAAATPPAPPAPPALLRASLLDFLGCARKEILQDRRRLAAQCAHMVLGVLRRVVLRQRGGEGRLLAKRAQARC
jgi:hypothetical protein